MENDYYNNGNDNRGPKKSKTWIWIVIAAVAAVLMIAAVVGGTLYLKKNTSPFLERLKEEVESDLAGETEKETRPTEKETERETDPTKPEKSDIGKSQDINSSDTQISGLTVMDASSVVEQAMPTVVAITDTRVYTYINNYNPYNFFFGSGNRSGSEEGKSSGSGVIIGTNGNELLIVTNNHVVDLEEDSYSSYSVKSKGLIIEFCDGSTANATIRGTDSAADLAVVSVKLSDLSSDTKDAILIAVIGDSDALKIGEAVVAIGNAGGYGQSVTAGIISAKNREVTIDNVTRKLLQTDAAINPGNSGGGLFNAKGELIGINCAKEVDTSIEGMGFAIPITYAETIIEELVTKETVTEEEKGYLGVRAETVATSYIKNYGYPAGASITSIASGSPAEEAKLQIYDIITKVNGKSITSSADLTKVIGSYKAGTTVEVTIQRPSGREFTEKVISVTLKTYKEIYPEEQATEPPTETETESEDDNSGSGFSLDDLYKYFFGW